MTIKDCFGYLCGAAVGSTIAYLLSYVPRFIANVNIKVRPELKNLRWYEAPFSGHFAHWVFGLYGDPLSIAMGVGGAALGVLAASRLMNKE